MSLEKVCSNSILPWIVLNTGPSIDNKYFRLAFRWEGSFEEMKCLVGGGVGVAKLQMHRMNEMSGAGLQRWHGPLGGRALGGELLSWGGQESRCQSQSAWL